MTYYARSRFAPKHTAPTTGAAAPAGPTVEEALLHAEAVMFRIRHREDRRGIGYHELIAYTADFQRIEFDYTDRDADQAIRDELLRLMFEQYPHIDWHRDHQINLDDGCIHAAPEPDELGWLPDEDLSFGELRPPHLIGAAA